MQSLLGVFIILLSVMLASCVSETTGGFNQANPEETLNDANAFPLPVSIGIEV